MTTGAKMEGVSEQSSTETTPAGHASRVKPWLGLLLAAVLVIAIDQGTKHLVTAYLYLGERHHLLGPLDLYRTENAGIAFGLAQGATALIAVLSTAAVLVLLYAFRRRPEGWWNVVPYALVLGGALSNLYDRLLAGRVVDFLSLPHWPTFNAADSAITVGVAWLVARAVLRAEL